MLSSNIIGYILKIATLIFLLNLILFLIKEGKTKSAIRFIFSCVIVVYAIFPLTYLQNCNNYSISNNNYVNLQNEFLEKNSIILKEKNEKIVSNFLKASKIEYKTVEIIVNEVSQKIEKINIILDSEGINEKDGHILSLEEIKSMVSNMLSLKKDVIYVEFS